MANDEEYYQLIYQRSNAQSQYNSCESRIENCDYLLQRLKSARSSISEIKKSFEGNKKLDKELYEENHDWKGSTYSAFDTKMVTLNEANESYYQNSIDYVLDALNDEITRITNQRMSEYGLLGQIGVWLNNLSNRINNYFN